MARLIDADKLRLSYWVSPTSTVSTAGQYYFYSQDEVDNAPTIDAEPVIRCKDCEYYNGEDQYCVNDIFAKPNGYCMYGKGKG